MSSEFTRLLSILLALGLLMSLMPVSAFAEGTDTDITAEEAEKIGCMAALVLDKKKYAR